jgi:hypothetical protein
MQTFEYGGIGLWAHADPKTGVDAQSLALQTMEPGGGCLFGATPGFAGSMLSFKQELAFHLLQTPLITYSGRSTVVCFFYEALAYCSSATLTDATVLRRYLVGKPCESRPTAQLSSKSSYSYSTTAPCPIRTGKIRAVFARAEIVLAIMEDPFPSPA